MNFKKIVPLTLSLLFALPLASCGNQQSVSPQSATPVTENTAKDTIVYGSFAAPDGIFNPLVLTTSRDKDITRLVYSQLLTLDKDLNFVPDLAESYEISDDNLVITFNIRTDAKFTDGTPLTVEDIAFTLRSMADPAYVGPLYGYVEQLVGAKEYRAGTSTDFPGVEIVDETTINLNFAEVYAPALINLGTIGILPKHIWEPIPISQWRENLDLLSKPVGSGLYTIAAVEQGQYVKLERNENYYNDVAKTKNLIYKLSNEETAQVELMNGDIDIVEVTNLKQSEKDALVTEGFATISYPMDGLNYLGLNNRLPMFEDKRVRQAFAYAIDTDSIISNVLEGQAIALDAPMLPKQWAYPTDTSILNKYDYNVEKAKELLKEVGYEDTNGDGIVDKDGIPLEFTLLLGNLPLDLNYTAPIIQQSLLDIGVKVNLSPMDYSSMIDQVVGQHNFEAYLMTNKLNPDPDPKPYWHSTSSSDEEGVYAWNIVAFNNPAADKLMEDGTKVIDRNARKEIYDQYAVIMNDEVPWVPLFSLNFVKAYNPNLKNFEPNTFLDMNNVQNWVIEE